MDDAKLKDYVRGEHISVVEAARLLKCSPSSIRLKIDSGELIAYRPLRKKYMLYKRQVLEVAGQKQACGIEYARDASGQLSFF